MALRADCDKIVTTEVFADQTHLRNLRYNTPDVDRLLRNGLDDFVIVVLEKLDVLAGNAILDKVVVPFDSELSKLSFCFGTFEIEDIRHLLFF